MFGFRLSQLGVIPCVCHRVSLSNSLWHGYVRFVLSPDQVCLTPEGQMVFDRSSASAEKNVCYGMDRCMATLEGVCRPQGDEESHLLCDHQEFVWSHLLDPTQELMC